MTAQANRPRKIVIDTDPGIDDALALMLAFASHEVEVELITTVGGNVPIGRVTENARRVLSLLRPSPMPALARGAARPLRRRLVDAAHVHGDDGLGGLSARRFGTAHAPAAKRDAVGRLVEQVRVHGSALRVVALGPLTNLAQAIERDPEVMSQVGRLIIMGGAIETAGNITPAAEYNFFADPDAADIVLGAGLPITLVPLDVTQRVALDARALREGLGASRSARAEAIRGMTRELVRRRGELYLHDPLAVAVALDPSLVKTTPMPVWVETQGQHTLGLSLAERRRDPAGRGHDRCSVDVALQVDSDRVIALFTERVLRPHGRAAGDRNAAPAPEVVVLGGANLDVTISTSTLPARGETVGDGKLYRDFGGKGANQAVAARRAGASVRLIAKLGSDPDGARFAEHLAGEGIGDEGLLQDPSEPTGTALILVNAQGENLISVAPGANATVTVQEIDALSGMIARAGVLVAPLEVPPAPLQRAFAVARANRVVTLLNAAPARPLPQRLARLVDVLVVNEVEAAMLSGKRVSDSGAPRAAVAALRERGFTQVVVTLGAAGAYWYAGRDWGHVPAQPVDAVDTVGAGDTFVGYLACALAEGWSLVDGVELASRAAGLSVLSAGAQAGIPRRGELADHSRY